MMPQTREHLEICELLGVRRGIVVLTKRDLVDHEWLELATSEVRAGLAGTFLADAAIVPVSARTGAGLPELRAAIAQLVAALPPRDSSGVFRLPIDRIFTIKGFGTVVTGTVGGGEVAVGDDLVVLPRGTAVRVRGIEVHGGAVPSARAGLRAAVNLHGVAVDDLVRGDVLARPDTVPASHILDVTFRYVAAARSPLAKRSSVMVHHGATSALAKLSLDVDDLAPGATATGQLRLDATTPIAALPGDRFIARGFAPLADHGTTLGGGEIVRVLAPRAREDHADLVDQLVAAKLGERLLVELRAGGPAGRDLADLARRAGQGADAVRAALDPLVLSGEVLAVGDVYFHGEAIAALERSLLAAIAEPVPRETLRTSLPASLPPRAFDALVDGLARRGAIVDGETVRRADAAGLPRLGPLDEALLGHFRGWALEPQRPKELPALIAQPEPLVKAALDRLLAHKLLVKVKPDLLVETSALAALRTRLIEFLAAHTQITPQQFKELTGASRKYSIPLAEYFDQEKVTLRIGDNRKRR
jgi:selenocysteine-specific elongation factor